MMARDAALVRLTVDHREAGSGVPEALATMPGVELNWEQLDAGDYVAGGLAVERKRCDDLAASIQDRRLFQQVERLQERCERVVVLIEGADLYGASRLHPNALRGAVSYLAVLAGISVVRTGDAEDSAALIATMARHALHGLGYALNLHHKPRAADLHLQVRYLVEQLPGIGPVLAETLLAHFGTARAVFMATAEELAAAPGIGVQRAAQIEGILLRTYDSGVGIVE